MGGRATAAGLHDLAVGVGEHQSVGVVGVAGDPELALVMQPVMPRTQARQIPGVGRTGAVVGVPVDDVMDVQEPIRAAARDAAAAVTQDHEAAGAFGHGALGASDTDRDPALLVDGGDDGVAADQVA